MAWDPELLASLEAALAQAPEQTALRLHVARLYAEVGRWVEALPHVDRVLSQDPANMDALTLACTGYEQIGQVERSSGYRTLLAALGRPVADQPPAPAPTQDPAGPAPPNTRDQAASGWHPSAPNPPGEHPLEEALPVSGASMSELDAFLEEVLSDAAELERPKITLDDVGGLADVKKRLNTSFLGPMRNPELRKMYGKSLRGGLLLYGPPGCGKTFLARAVAGELGAHFFGIGLHEVLDMWLGKSEQNVHKVFETARRNAPCVIFLDEVDALGMKRSNLSHSAGRNVVVQLLSELDSTGGDNEGVFVLAATNQPWDIDPALRRPGRLDRMLLVLPPDGPARASIIGYHLRDRPVDPSVRIDKLAGRTDGYSGADLRLVCESAAEYALEDSVQSGKPRSITTQDFDRAAGEIRPSTRPWFEMAKNYALFANDSGEYDELLTFMRRNRLA